MRSLCLFTVLLGVVPSVEGFGLLGRAQSAAVRGKLICNGKPAEGVTVKLWDEDHSTIDDLLEGGITDINGNFYLAGCTREFGPIDPKLNVYHDCNDPLSCQRKITIKICDEYITDGKVPEKVFDAGVLELSGRFPGERRDCIN